MQLDLNIPEGTVSSPRNSSNIDVCEIIQFQDIAKLRLEKTKQAAIRSALKMSKSAYIELTR